MDAQITKLWLKRTWQGFSLQIAISHTSQFQGIDEGDFLRRKKNQLPTDSPVSFPKDQWSVDGPSNQSPLSFSPEKTVSPNQKECFTARCSFRISAANRATGKKSATASLLSNFNVVGLLLREKRVQEQRRQKKNPKSLLLHNSYNFRNTNPPRIVSGHGWGQVKVNHEVYIIWLVVSTHLKNISQIGSFPTTKYIIFPHFPVCSLPISHNQPMSSCWISNMLRVWSISAWNGVFMGFLLPSTSTKKNQRNLLFLGRELPWMINLGKWDINPQ